MNTEEVELARPEQLPPPAVILEIIADLKNVPGKELEMNQP